MKHFYSFVFFYFQLCVFVVAFFGCGFCLFLVFNNVFLFVYATHLGFNFWFFHLQIYVELHFC